MWLLTGHKITNCGGNHAAPHDKNEWFKERGGTRGCRRHLNHARSFSRVVGDLGQSTMRWPRRSWCPGPERSRRVQRLAMARRAHTTRLEGEMATRGDIVLAALDLRVSPFLIGVYRPLGERPTRRPRRGYGVSPFLRETVRCGTAKASRHPVLVHEMLVRENRPSCQSRGPLRRQILGRLLQVDCNNRQPRPHQPMASMPPPHRKNRCHRLGRSGLPSRTRSVALSLPPIAFPALASPPELRPCAIFQRERRTKASCRSRPSTMSCCWIGPAGSFARTSAGRFRITWPVSWTG